MIKRLRIKLILVIMGVLVLVFGGVITMLNLAVYYNSVQQTESFIAMIAENDGFMIPQRNTVDEIEPHEGPAGSGHRGDVNFDDMRARRFFYVKIDHTGNLIDTDFSMMFDFTEADALAYLSEALNSEKSSGNVDYYFYGIEEKGYGKIIVFAERRVETDMLSQLTSTSLIIAGIFCVALLVLSIFLSRWMVAPIKKAFEKQRRFISDANHELKTPLTIISANVDLLNKEVGDNERFGTIHAQLSRMSKLIGNLLTLSKIEDSDDTVVYSPFNLSKAMLSATLAFESRAFEDEKKYHYEIAENITYVGDEEKLKSLLSILVDNALKHSEKGSDIKVTLKLESGKPFLAVHNTGVGIADAEKDKIFDRFYRSDSSRARETGGYGLGLSIAKSIVDAHKGKIKVNSVPGQWIEFVVVL